MIVVSNRLDLVFRTLRDIPEITRLLNMGESFVPLAAEERDRIETLSNNHNCCIDMSVGGYRVRKSRCSIWSSVWARGDDSECEPT